MLFLVLFPSYKHSLLFDHNTVFEGQVLILAHYDGYLHIWSMNLTQTNRMEATEISQINEILPESALI